MQSSGSPLSCGNSSVNKPFLSKLLGLSSDSIEIKYKSHALHLFLNVFQFGNGKTYQEHVVDLSCKDHVLNL